MPFPKKTLSVVPNPWLYIDHLGRPAGRVPFDAFEHSASPGFVGAGFASVELVARAMTMRVAGRDLEVNPAQHDHRIAYSRSPVPIPTTNYYKAAIKNGELFAADQETALESGIRFTSPALMLDQAKKEAVERFNAETGDDAYSRFGSVDPIYIPEAATAAPVEKVNTK